MPECDYDALVRARRCRLVLATAGIFPEGWRLPGMAAGGAFELGNIRGRVVCAAVPRAEVVSGWDLAAWRQGTGGPKPDQLAAPSGSVDWIDELDATPEQLRKLVAEGRWPARGYDAMRRCEGCNRFSLAVWP